VSSLEIIKAMAPRRYLAVARRLVSVSRAVEALALPELCASRRYRMSAF
jgi:hypothetical protein